MPQFLFIESQDPLENRGSEFYLETALDLRRQEQQVTVFFVENGAHAVRDGAQNSSRDALLAAGVSLKVDEFALRERGIGQELLAPGVGVGAVEDLVDLLADPETRAVWH